MNGRTVYVFLAKRDIDREEWPLVYTDLERAEEAPGRCSEVITVDFDAERAPPAMLTEMRQAVAELREAHNSYEALPPEMHSPAGDANHVGRGALLDLVEHLLEGRITL